MSGGGYVYNPDTEEWEEENVTWYIDLLARGSKKVDGVLNVKDHGMLTGHKPVISVDISKDYCNIFFYSVITKYNENGALEEFGTVVTYRFVYDRETKQVIIELWNEDSPVKYLVNAGSKEDAEIIYNSYLKKISDRVNGE